jgi:hypothetical protein
MSSIEGDFILGSNVVLSFGGFAAASSFKLQKALDTVKALAADPETASDAVT